MGRIKGWLIAGLGLCLLSGLAQGQHGVAIDPEAELIVAVAAETSSMEPHHDIDSTRPNYSRQVFESLVAVDAMGQPTSGLALSWKALDPYTWEFVLRRGVAFHNGEPFHADTVLFNLERLFQHGQAGQRHPEVQGWSKVDAYTVRITTTVPAPTLWDFIGRAPLLPKDYTIKNGIAGLHDRPVGTGPWRMVEWKRNEHMLFERYEQYWGEIPLFKQLRFRIIPQGAARVAALHSGEVHVIEAVPPMETPEIAKNTRLHISSHPHKLLCRLYLNGRTQEHSHASGPHGLFVDPKVRFALNLAIDRDQLVQKIFYGYAAVSASPVASGSYGYAPQEPYPYDPQQARALLAEAGWHDRDGDGILDKDGQPLRLELWFPAGHYGQGFDAMTPAVGAMLEALGMQIVLKPVDFNMLLAAIRQGTFPPHGGFTACRTSQQFDADDYLRDWATASFHNWSPYPPELLALYRKSQQETDSAARLRLVAELQHQIRTWAPVIALYQETTIYAHSQKVLGFQPSAAFPITFQGVALQQ